ncbi:MAG TPA: SLBB domain-containing protein [Clostridia bacterium]|nr:SLBB domain-containing protein [Clostridia bacterium]
MKKTGIIVSLLLLFILGFWFKLYGLTPLEVPQRQIFVHIEGEVTKPGLYEIAEDLRLGDLVELAGGLTDKAEGINLAKKLIDGEKIIISRIWQEDAEDNQVQNSPSIIREMTLEEWMEIPGVGEVTARAIMEYLRKNPGAKVDELIEVNGIGEKKLQILKEHLGNL